MKICKTFERMGGPPWVAISFHGTSLHRPESRSADTRSRKPNRTVVRCAMIAAENAGYLNACFKHCKGETSER